MLHRLARLWVLLVAFSAGCGEVHEAVDGGSDAGPVPRGCVDLLAADEGSRCEDLGVLCREGGDRFCAEHTAPCVDGRVRHEHAVWVFGRGDGRSCTVGDVDVMSSGPEGSLRFDQGTASALGGFTNSMTLLFSSGTPFYECERPRLVVSFAPDVDLNYTGTLAARASLHSRDGSIDLTGSAQIDSYGPDSGRMTGSLSLTGQGHSVTGPFEVDVCSELFVPSL